MRILAILREVAGDALLGVLGRDRLYGPVGRTSIRDLGIARGAVNCDGFSA